jgi:hypothetical protein
MPSRPTEAASLALEAIFVGYDAFKRRKTTFTKR